MLSWADVGPLLVTLIVAGGGLLFVLRHGGGTALAELERANRILEGRVKALEAENLGLHAQVATLEAKTDIAAALEPLTTQLRDHDSGSRSDNAVMIGLLERIADTVAPASVAD